MYTLSLKWTRCPSAANARVPRILRSVNNPNSSQLSSHQALEREEAELYQSKDDILKQSQRLTASFLEQKGELEGSTRRAEERATIADGKLSALQEELDAARCGFTAVLVWYWWEKKESLRAFILYL